MKKVLCALFVALFVMNPVQVFGMNSDNHNELKDEEMKDEEIKDEKKLFPEGFFSTLKFESISGIVSFDDCEKCEKEEETDDANENTKKRGIDEINTEKDYEIDSLCNQVNGLGLTNFLKNAVEMDYAFLMSYLDVLDNKNFIEPISKEVDIVGKKYVEAFKSLELSSLAKSTTDALKWLILNIEFCVMTKEMALVLINSFFDSLIKKVESDKEAEKALNAFFKGRKISNKKSKN